MTARNGPVDDCVKAVVALLPRQLRGVHGPEVSQQELNLLDEHRVVAPAREPSGAIGTGGNRAELLGVTTAKEQRLLTEPEAAEETHFRQHHLIGATEWTLKRCA